MHDIDTVYRELLHMHGNSEEAAIRYLLGYLHTVESEMIAVREAVGAPHEPTLEMFLVHRARRRHGQKK